jgi:hypothetical protein
MLEFHLITARSNLPKKRTWVTGDTVLLPKGFASTIGVYFCNDDFVLCV